MATCLCTCEVPQDLKLAWARSPGLPLNLLQLPKSFAGNLMMYWFPYTKPITLMLVVDNLANSKWCKTPKKWLKLCSGMWVLDICEYSARALQWIPTRKGLDGFQKYLRPYALTVSCLGLNFKQKKLNFKSWENNLISNPDKKKIIISSSEKNTHLISSPEKNTLNFDPCTFIFPCMSSIALGPGLMYEAVMSCCISFSSSSSTCSRTSFRISRSMSLRWYAAPRPCSASRLWPASMILAFCEPGEQK